MRQLISSFDSREVLSELTRTLKSFFDMTVLLYFGTYLIEASVDLYGLMGSFEYENLLLFCFISTAYLSVMSFIMLSKSVFGIFDFNSSYKVRSIDMLPFVFLAYLLSSELLLFSTGTYEYDSSAFKVIDENILIVLVSLIFLYQTVSQSLVISGVKDMLYPNNCGSASLAVGMSSLRSDDLVASIRTHEAAHFVLYKLFDEDGVIVDYDEVLVARGAYVGDNGGFMRKKSSGSRNSPDRESMMLYSGYLSEKRFHSERGTFESNYSDFNKLAEQYALRQAYYGETSKRFFSLNDYIRYIEAETDILLERHEKIIKEVSFLLSASNDVLTAKKMEDCGIYQKIQEDKEKYGY